MPKVPGIPHRRAVAAFEKAGYWVAREGKHIVMTNGTRTLVIPRHDPINAYTLGQIVVGAGMTVDDFKRLL